MPLNFVTADERLNRPPKINVALTAPSGAGKTTQARTLDPETTLFLDLEAGDLALGDWPGTVLHVRSEAARLGVHPWEMCRALACLLGGPDPSAKPGSPYSAEMHQQYCQHVIDPAQLASFSTLFWDSITVAGRWSFAWCQRQPEAFSEKTGKYDGRGAYGLHGQEMVTWLTQIQHILNRSTIVVGILDAFKDDFGRMNYEMQIDGGKTGRELPGIFDEVITLGLFSVGNDGTPKLDIKNGTQRAFVCHLNNGFGVPAKDRSGRLDMIEPPDLGALLKKIAGGERRDTLVTAMPAAAAHADTAGT